MELWATWSSGRCHCSWQGGWKWMIFNVPSNRYHSMILWFYDLDAQWIAKETVVSLDERRSIWAQGFHQVPWKRWLCSCKHICASPRAGPMRNIAAAWTVTACGIHRAACPAVELSSSQGSWVQIQTCTVSWSSLHWSGLGMDLPWSLIVWEVSLDGGVNMV